MSEGALAFKEPRTGCIPYGWRGRHLTQEGWAAGKPAARLPSALLSQAVTIVGLKGLAIELVAMVLGVTPALRWKTRLNQYFSAY